MAKKVPRQRESKNQMPSSDGDVATQEPEIVIIGGGIAGLYCGFRLKEKEHQDFVICEESDHIGGRIWSTRILGGGHVADDSVSPKPNNDSSGFTCDGEPVEFVAEFGPMRIELDRQKLLERLLRGKLDMGSDIEPFPPYESPISEHDPKYDLRDEEKDQDTPLDLLRLAVIRILGRLRSAETKTGPESFDEKLTKLMTSLSTAVATRQPRWKDLLLRWAEGLSEADYQNIRQHGVFDDGTKEGTSLWEMGFWNLLSEVLSHQAVIKIRDLGTFYHLIPENPNAAEWLIFWLRAFATSEQLVGIRGGMQRITERMGEKIGSDRIKTNWKLIGMAPKDKKIELTFKVLDATASATHRTLVAKDVILAMPAGPMQQLANLNQHAFSEAIQRDLAAVFGFPLVKFFVSVKERWWEDDLAFSNRNATLIPTREIHYWKSSMKNSSKGLMMVYTDRPATTFWSNYIKHEEGPGAVRVGIQTKPEQGCVCDDHDHLRNPRLVTRMLHYLREWNVTKKPKDLQFYGIRDWGREPYRGAAHAWYPERRSWEHLKRLSAFALKNDRLKTTNVHVCGEAYSDYQAFIEGALRSAEHVLHTIDRKKFRCTPTAWLCNEQCMYDAPEEETARLRMPEKACANT